jgi:hypothetical protein
MRVVAATRRDYGALPRRLPLRAESRAGSPGQRPQGLRRGAADADHRVPGLESGAAFAAPSVPWPCRVPLLPSPPARNPVRASPDPPLLPAPGAPHLQPARLRL